MKTCRLVMAMVLAVGVSVAQAGPKTAGPTGGKLLESKPRVEFLVNAARQVEIRLFDADLKPLPLSGVGIGIIAQAPSGKVALTMADQSGVLVSSEALPEGDGYTVVVQVRASATSKPQNFRIPLHLETCSGCHLAEYACTCESHEGEGGHEGHGH